MSDAEIFERECREQAGRVRRLAKRKGYIVRKSRTRIQESPRYGVWDVYEFDGYNIQLASGEFGWGLDDLEAWLTAQDDRPRD